MTTADRSADGNMQPARTAGIHQPMPYEFTMTRRVEFSETDMAGIMHFSNYFRYMESVEHAFFRSLGLAVHASSPQGMHGWARVHAACDFKAPLRYQDEVEVHLLVAEKRSKSITYIAEFRRPDGTEIARGRWTVVCVTRDRDEAGMTSAPIPDAVNQKIEAAPPEALPQEDR